MLLEYNNPQDPVALWQQFKRDLAADFKWTAQQNELEGARPRTTAEVENDALWEIEQLLQQASPAKSLAEYTGMPMPYRPHPVCLLFLAAWLCCSCCLCALLFWDAAHLYFVSAAALEWQIVLKWCFSNVK